MKGTTAGRALRILGVLAASAYSIQYACAPADWHFIDNADLVFHEAGHAIFALFGDFIHILMGSGFQILLPLSIAGYFFFDRQRISGAIALMWAGINLISVSVYAGDAIAMQLPLLGGDSVVHDWNYILSELAILQWTPLVSGALYWLGAAAIGIGMALSFWFAIQAQAPGTSDLSRNYF